jgi:hypothetical protein
VNYLGFYADTNSPDLTITLSNNSTETLTNVVISIQGLGNSDSVTVSPNATAIATLPVAGTAVGSTVNMTISCNATGNGTMGVSFNMDSLLVDTVSAVDSLVQFIRSFTNDYDLTDTMDVDFLDLEDGVFQYSMENHTGLFLDAKGIHHDMWKTEFCKQANRQYEDILDLVNASPQPNQLDSNLFFGGILMQSFTPVPPDTDQIFLAKNIAKYRIFPQWDSSQQRSETYVEYIVKTPAPTGRILSISASDSIVFWIRSDFIWGERLCGRLAITYERPGDTVSVPVEYPSFLNSMSVNILVTTRMPDTAYLDTVFLGYSLWDPANPLDITSGRDTLLKARNGSVYGLSVDMTAFINRFPDSLMGAFRTAIPAGSEVQIISDSFPSGPFDALSRMTVNVDAQYNLQSTALPLGTQKMDLGYVMLSRLEEPQARMDLNMTNHAGLDLRLLCLMAPEEKAAGLDTLATNHANYLSDQLTQPGITSGGYINLLGPGGVAVPGRGGSRNIQITLTEAMLDSVFKARGFTHLGPDGDSIRVFEDWEVDTLGNSVATYDTLYSRYESRAAMYWQMQLDSTGLDALHDTDFVRINGSFYLEGIAK